jgi:hypothetical protein
MDMAQDKAMIKKAFKQHDTQEHKGGKGTKLALKKGGDTMASKMDPKMMAVMTKAKRPRMPMAGKIAASNPTMSGMSEPGTPTMMKKGGMAKSDAKEDMKMDMAQDKAMIKKAIKQHDEQEHQGGMGTKLKLAKGGSFRSAANGVAKKGLTKGTMVKMAKGGKYC